MITALTHDPLQAVLVEISCKERELGFAAQSLLESDDQLRRLVGAIDSAASGSQGAIKPVEMARLVDSALSLNVRLRDQAKNLELQLSMLKSRAKRG